MIPSVHTTITYGIDSALIFPLMFLGIMVILGIMSYSESKGDPCMDAKQIKKLIDEYFNERKKDQERAREQRYEKIRKGAEEIEQWRRAAELAAEEYVTNPELKEWADFIGDSVVYYRRNELVSAEDFAKNIDVLIDRLNDHEVEKIGILHNDTLSAVVVSPTQYQRLLKYSELSGKEEKHHDNA